MPVTRRLLADGETPVGVYRKLAGGPGSFLLESAEHGASAGGMVWSRYSFVGVRSVATLTSDGRRRRTWLGAPPPGLPTQRRPGRGAARDGRRAGVAGAAGHRRGPAAADRRPGRIPRVRHRPPLRDAARSADDDLHVPDLGMMLATDLVVLDHFTGSALLVANVIVAPGARTRRPPRRLPPGDRAARRDDDRAVPPDAADGVHGRPCAAGRSTSRVRPEGLHQKAVEQAKEAIRDGECFQIVVAQRFERPTDADPLDIYRVLRMTNPSPYMYLLRFDELRRRRLVAGGARQGHRPAGRCCTRSPVPAGAARPRRRTPRSPPSCSPTRRSAPST